MTIVMYASTPKSIVLAADGLSTEKIREAGKKDRTEVTSDRLQKIFPIALRPFAVVHCGINRIKGVPVSELLQRSIGGIPKELPLRDFASALKTALDPLVEAIWEEMRDYGNTVSFWVTGFNPEGERQIYELHWWWFKTCLLDKIEELWPGEDIYGGYKDEAKSVRNNLFKSRICDMTTGGIQESFRKIFRAMTTRQPDLVGGYYRELTITSDGHRWTGPNANLRDCMVTQ